MILKQSLLLLLIVFTVFSLKINYNEKGKRMHYCPSCATKGYVVKRWLMQHSESGQSMGWYDWRGSNCEEGIVLVVPCTHACLTVIVEKQRGTNEYEYAGAMQECSDELIHSSPDLPEEIDFKAYNETKTYVSKRMNHRITYNFTTTSYIDLHYHQAHDFEMNETVYLSETKMTKLNAFTFKDGVSIGAVIFSVVIFISMCIMLCRRKSSSRKQPLVIPMKRADGVEDISASLAVENVASSSGAVEENSDKTEETVETKDDCPA